MFKVIGFSILGLVCGAGIGIIIFMFARKEPATQKPVITEPEIQKKMVLGFLPYWLIGSADKHYPTYVDTIAYFGLTVDHDGSIQKFTAPGESEPGFLALTSGKADKVIGEFQKDNLKRSLVVFSGDQESIEQLMDDPKTHAETLVDEISPILDEYKFTDLNLDIERAGIASESARVNFTAFVQTIADRLSLYHPTITISIDISPTALIKPYLVDVDEIAAYVDTVIFMTYDYHYQGSSVTGAVSPVGGAGETAEYDTETAIHEALRVLPPEKIIVGVPLYGYEWESLRDYPRSAVIPGTGITASNKRVEELLESCATCSAEFDETDQESYIIYKDEETNTFHQIFYPDKRAVQAKINLVEKYNLGGLALWALGYDGDTILEPLRDL